MLAGRTALDCRTMAGFFRQVFGAANLLFQPLLLLPFCSLWATPQEALFEAPFCNPFYFVFAVLAGWEVALGAGSASFRTLDGLCLIVVQHWC